MARSHKQNQVLQMALQYAELGWHVLPVRKDSKAPATRYGVKDATNDLDEIRRTFSQGEFNIGVAAGVSGFSVLDIDPRNGGDETLKDLEREHGRLPKTFIVHTGGGGTHYYFRVPEGRKLQNFKGIDGKNHGGYVVAPPSIHPDTGKAYEWDDFLHPFDGKTKIADAPEWLLKQTGKSMEAPRNTGGDLSPEIVKEIKSALAVLDPNCSHDEWVAIGMAIHSTGADLFDIWDEWSQDGDTYDAIDIEKAWASFGKERGRTLELLFYKAENRGWVRNLQLLAANISDAIGRLKDDPGAMFEPDIAEAVRRIRADSPAEFARIRQKVKATKQVQIAEFDAITTRQAPGSKIAQTEAINTLFPMVEPWPDPVDGALLLNEITATIQRHIIGEVETLRAAALWCVMTWLVDSVRICPIANITAPEKRCGKSELLSVLGRLSRRQLQVSGISPSALFRCIELWKPTLLIDEVDAFLSENEEARGILNAGFTRDSAFIVRCVGDDHAPTPFNIWGAKALCGIGKIQDTLADRSIPLRLRRKKPGEKVEQQGRADPSMWERLRSMIARFADDVAPEIEAARPAIIQGLNDRANDCWEPLLAIAEAAGGDWPKLAKQAAITLHGIEEDTPTIGVELLRDIKTIFDEKRSNKLFTSDLLEALTTDDEQPWATWNRGKAMSPRQLASKLADFGIKSKQIRIGSVTGKKGFEVEDFKDAWYRYLPQLTPQKLVYDLQPTDGMACSNFSNSTGFIGVEDQKTIQPTDGAGCSGVDEKIPRTKEGRESRQRNEDERRIIEAFPILTD